MRFVFIKRSWLIFTVISFVLLVCGLIYFNPDAAPVASNAEEEHEVYKFNMVTGEFATKDEAGNEIEAYRWDPGTIVVPVGKEITLSIYGVNGKEHPFFIEGTNVKGNVKKGEETVVTMKFAKEGTYRIICTAHPDIDNNGPMIGYIVVD